MQISVKSDLKQLTRKLDRIQKQQVPFATSLALNTTAFQAQDTARKVMPSFIDRPTRFTVTGIQTQRSSKRNLTAIVYIPENRWKYMKFAVVGGTAAKGNVPVNAKLNKYGSMGRTYLRRMARRSDTFSGTVKGQPGLWQRQKGGGVKLIAAYETRLSYSKRFPFARLVQAQVNQRFAANFDRAMKRALATAR